MFGTSAEFYSRLYSGGMLNRDYDYQTDYSAGTATIMLGGESAEPQRVLAELNAELARVFGSGLDEAAFEAARRASFGSRLRGLESFDSLCLSLVDGIFGGYCALDAYEVLKSVTKAECEDFLKIFMTPDRLAMSVINPVKA